MNFPFSFWKATEASGTPPTFVGAATTTLALSASATVNYPTVQANDIMLLAFVTDTQHVANGTPPTGWTLLHALDGSTDTTMTTFWKRATGSEGSTEVWTNIFNASEQGGAAVVAYRGCVATGSPINASVNDAVVSSAPETNVTTTVNNCIVVSFFGCDPASDPYVGSWTAPATERIDSDTAQSGQNGTLSYIGVGDQTKATAGAVQTIMTSTSDTWVRAGYALLPA